MKNLSIVLNVVLLVAVAVLYVLHFSSKKQDSSSQTASEVSKMDNSTIVFINSDSVVANYEYIKDKQKEMESKTLRLDAEYKNRAQGLQTEFDNYQKNAANLTMGQARAVEEDLLKKQQNLKLYEQSLMQEMANNEGEISRELYEQVSKVVAEYGVNNGIHIVFKYNQGSDVLYANEGMDITYKVIDLLNSEYLSSKENAVSDSVNMK